MKTLGNKAATSFGLTLLGAGFCAAIAIVASLTDPQELDANPAYKAETPSPKAAAPQPTEPAEPVAKAAPVEMNLDPASVAKGKQNYEMFCLACHGAEDTTIDSPSNLFDSKWYHGSGRSGIENTIKSGISEKGMPGWEAMIPSEDISALVDYLISFQQQ